MCGIRAEALNLVVEDTTTVSEVIRSNALTWYSRAAG
jgi:hypothetical protein